MIFLRLNLIQKYLIRHKMNIFNKKQSFLLTCSLSEGVKVKAHHPGLGLIAHTSCYVHAISINIQSYLLDPTVPIGPAAPILLGPTLPLVFVRVRLLTYDMIRSSRPPQFVRRHERLGVSLETIQ